MGNDPPTVQAQGFADVQVGLEEEMVLTEEAADTEVIHR